MKNDVLNPLTFCGYDLSPLPLDFTNELTTTKWLGVLLAKLNNVLEFTKNIYNIILEDLTTDGELYKALTSAFTNQINDLENEIKLIQDRLDKLEYIKPIIETVDTYNYYFGDVVNGAVFNYSIKHSETIEKIELLHDGVVINNITSNISDEGFISTNKMITSDSTFSIKVYDGVSVVENEIKFNFYSPFYFGEYDDKPNLNQILNSNKVLNNDGELVYIVENVVNKKPCIVTDHEVSIYDQNNNLITDGFNISNIDITLDKVRTFKIYLFDNFITCDNFKFKIIY